MANAKTLNITVKSQGQIWEVDFNSFHPDAQDYLKRYGTQRAVNDFINSRAKTRRDDGGDITEKWVSDTYASRLDQFMTGELSTRGDGADPLDTYRVQAVRDAIKNEPASEMALAYAAIDSKDQKARIEYCLEVAAEYPDQVDPYALDLMAEAEAKKARRKQLKLA